MKPSLSLVAAFLLVACDPADSRDPDPGASGITTAQAETGDPGPTPGGGTDEGGDASTASAPSDDGPSTSDGADDTQADLDDGDAEDDGNAESTGGEPPGGDGVAFDIVMRQTVQSCSGCGIWFDWQGADANKPRLEVTWTSPEQGTQTSIYQHGAGQGDAYSFFLSPEAGPGAAEHRHSMLVKQSPHRTGLFSTELVGIPSDAVIDDATLWLHLNTDEGLSNSDNESVLEVWSCPTAWNWDDADWTQATAGTPWGQAGGDFGTFIREIRAFEDMHALGYSKANPNVPFDFTAYVAELNAAG